MEDTGAVDVVATKGENQAKKLTYQVTNPPNVEDNYVEDNSSMVGETPNQNKGM